MKSDAEQLRAHLKAVLDAASDAIGHPGDEACWRAWVRVRDEADKVLGAQVGEWGR